MDGIFSLGMLNMIGNTPLLKLSNLGACLGLRGELYGKAEFVNPTGSIKDRSALFMLRGALERGVISRDSTVIEVTAGSSAVSLAAVCAALRLACVIVAPDDAPPARLDAIRSLGAKIVTTPAAGGTEAAKEAAESLCRRLGNAVILDPFASDDNAEAHRQGTAAEILASGLPVDYLVAGIGTGGTITGCGEAIRRHFPECRVIGVEPAESAVLSGRHPGSHGITGIGAGFVPEILNTYILNEVVQVRTPDAAEGCRILAQKEGLLCGISSGAALVAAVNVARREEAAGKNVVCILPDRG